MNARLEKTVGLALLFVVAAGCPRPRPAPPRGHALAERIWDARARRWIDERALVRALAARRYVTLGEKHDNPRHHQLQARLLRALVAAGRRPAVVWEMISARQRPALEAFLRRADRSAAAMGAAIGWARSGWPPWRLYLPIAAVALARGLPQLAGGTDRQALMEAGRGRRTPSTSLPPALARELAAEVKQAHCGFGSPRILAGMVIAQQLRDQAMARALLAGHQRGGDGAVLIAGGGHARGDRGVPYFLRVAGVDGDAIATLALREARADAELPRDHAHDFVWFTAPVDEVDPCVKFRRQLERMRRR